MIEPTDASKCDERQVENKPKPLAHKKKGATHIMGIQGMKTWKLGAFFVISLMLMAGLFADTASAQKASVTVRPASGDSGAVLDSVMVTYRVTEAIPGTEDQNTPVTPTDATDDAAITNTVVIDLPTDWTPAGTDFGASFTARRAGRTSEVWTSGTTGSYVEVEAKLRVAGATASGTAPTISGTEVTVVVGGGMSVGDRIIVTYYNVKVHPLTATEITALATMPHVENFSVTETTTLSGAAAFTYHDPTVTGATAAQLMAIKDMTAFNVTLPTQSLVQVRPPSITAGEQLETLSVTYTVQDGVFEQNAITFRLPGGWMPQTIGESTDAGYNTFLGTNTRTVARTENMHSWTSVDPTDPSTNPATTAHITVEARFGRRSGGTTPFVDAADPPASTMTVAVTAATADAQVVVTVPSSDTAPMLRGDTITVTFNKVQARELRPIEFADAATVEDEILVADNIDGSMYDASITVDPPMQSAVSLNLDSVNQGDIVDITVTYVVQEEMLFGTNNILIGLPAGWGAAYRASGTETTETMTSFGANVLTRAPSRSSDRSRTSYVVLTTNFMTTSSAMITDHDPTATTPTFLGIDASAYDAYLDIPVTGGMVRGDTITVAFNNVRVQALEQTEPAPVPLTVIDSIPNSNYTSNVTIEVIPPKLGNVTVTSTPKDVFTESTVDLKVMYTARGVLANSTATSPTYGRIRVQLPAGWGPNDNIRLDRPVGEPDATYLSKAGSSSGVTFAPAAVTGDPTGLSVSGTQSSGYIIDIDVNKMTARRQVTLTIHNLMVAELMEDRTNRYEDLTAMMRADKVQVMVSSSTYASAAARNAGTPTHSPYSFSPSDTASSETQPTILVKRKEQGEVTVAPNSVTAGDKVDFTITYKATQEMVAGEVIEIKLPDDWAAPMVYQVGDATPTSEQDASYVYLKGSAARLEGAEIMIIDGDGDEANTGDPVPEGGWFVQITLGTNGASKNSTVVLQYNDVTVQRALAKSPKLVIETFSGSTIGGLPQYPVVKLAEDTIEVKEAADGSGMVTFMYESLNVTSMDGKDSAGVALVSNTDASIPAGLDKDDLRELVVTYTPAGDMGAGGGEFKFRLPSDWKAEEVRVSTGTHEVSGNTVTVDFDPHFGEAPGDMVDITFDRITVPKEHGEVGFTAKSKNAGGTLKQLSPRPMAFVGNAEATNDTVAVTITPKAAYEDWKDVDFEIEITNAGPMHDSQIRITVPEGLSDLTDAAGDAAKANFVKMMSTTARNVRLSTLNIIDEDIIINTGKLNANGRLRVSFNNVDLNDVTTTDNSDGKDATTGFRVATRTRGSGPAQTDLDYADLDLEPYEPIQKTNGERSIVGGLIRTINGSGTMVVEPMIIEQNSRDETITLTYTAAATFAKKDLIIQLPSVIETDLQETNSSGKGHVSTTTARFATDVKAADRLTFPTTSTIKWTGVKLRRDQTFVTIIKRVDLLEYTGNFTWETDLGGVPLAAADNKPMVVVGTTAEDVAFQIVENGGVPVLAPSYPAASEQSIRFRFTAKNTAIQPGGSLRFAVPGRWTLPSITDRMGRATVSIVALNDVPIEDKDGNPIAVTQLPKTGEAGAGNKMKLAASGNSVTLTIGAKGGIARGDSVTIQYGSADLTKFPIEIPSSVAGTAGNPVDGLAIHGSYRVSGETGFRQRSAGTVWVDVSNVEDGTGKVSVTPPSVRASSTDNLMRITYTAEGTMDGGAVHLIIPDTWGAAQDDDNTAANYLDVEVGTGAVLTAYEVLNSGRSVEATLKTLGAGDTVMFIYGGGAGPNRGAAAQAEIGEATFIVQSRGDSGGDFVDITDEDSLAALTIDVKGAASGSGTATVMIMNNKSGEVVYDTATGAERRIFAGDDMTYLEFTYTAEQSIDGGKLEFIVPMGWSDPQQEDTNDDGYTYLEGGNAVVSEVEYNGQSVAANIAMERGDTVKIHYGWYDTEDGGAHAPSMAGTSVFGVNFDGASVADPPSVIVHGGTASKLVVTAPSSVSADAGAMPGAITVEIQDDTDAAAVLADDLMVTLSSTSSTGSFADADGMAIANNMVTISAGMTSATAYYSDTGAGTTATIRAVAVGLDSARADIEITSDVDRVDANSVAVSSATAKAGDMVTVSASGTAGKTATFSVGGVVTNGTMTESPAGSGSYSGSFTVVVESHDGTHPVTVTIGDASDTVANAITIDTSAPTISASASAETVANGGMVTITATVVGATSVTADVSALDTTQTTVTLAMANGAYSADVTVSANNAAANGAKTITVTAMDAVGNSAMADVMVTLDNKMSFTSMIPSGTVLFHVPLNDADISTVGDLVAALGTAVNLATIWNTAESRWDSDTDDVMITADLGIVLSMNAEASLTFEGDAWGGGTSSITVHSGRNLIGVPVNDPALAMVSDLLTAFGAGVVSSVSVLSGSSFVSIGAAGDPGDTAIMGDVAYVVTAASDKTTPLIGSGWTNGTASAAPIALAGYSVDNQTAVLDVRGSVVDEITGVAKEGFRVKVKNLATKAALSSVSSVETSDGYDMTFVDVSDGYSARVGDVLEISADSPNPLIGVKPVRHIVTVDDVKNNRIQLENLIAYEIPAETELLRNYPNPFNPETWIPYHLAEDADVTLRIYALSGELVRTIDVGHQTAAKYDTRSKALYWDGRNRFGEQVASGVYFYSLSAGDFSATRKMVILK